MHYCPLCNHILSVINAPKNQKGGADDTIDENSETSETVNKTNDINKLISDILANKTIDTISSDDKDAILQSQKYIKLKSIDQHKVYQYLFPESVNSIYYKCNNCQYTTQINDGEVIMIKKISSTNDNNSYKPNHIQNMQYSNTLNHTRKYKCPNEQCASHDNNEIKEAVFFKENNSYRILYICTVCKTSFNYF